MVFSSIPPYLDPSNWQQQQTHQQPIRTSGFPILPLPPPPGGGGSIRPGSMAERARMANIPLPEPALKCPRCDSTNTKFCYFNNYSLSQPRHFCKACRRYWTRGGALRSVPVGGGCRRNKRSKSSSSSKSSSAQTTTTTSTPAAITTNSNNYMNMNNMLGLPPRFISPLPQFSDSLSFSGDHHMGLTGYNPITASPEMNFNAGFLDGGSIEPWKMHQQFPFMEQFQGESSFMGGIQRPKFSMMSGPGSIKMEERPPQELNLSRQLLGGLMPAGNEQWSNNNNNDGSNAGNWTELGNFSSSSTSNPL